MFIFPVKPAVFPVKPGGWPWLDGKAGRCRARKGFYAAEKLQLSINKINSLFRISDIIISGLQLLSLRQISGQHVVKERQILVGSGFQLIYNF
ncbi:MAG: hypothetical protein KF862_22585 [Chitinophagaceae bacterium]|nr:hypothetical protein [Chitinophagaceae bacterium]